MSFLGRLFYLYHPSSTVEYRFEGRLDGETNLSLASKQSRVVRREAVRTKSIDVVS